MPKVPFWVFILLALLHFSAIRVDTMDIDASQYAEMSREMMVSGDYLHIFDRGMDYLDKPPFLFWVSSLSMKVFGVNNLGYKFPSILFALWAIFVTYRLAKLLYDDRTGRIAALVLGCCQGLFLMTNDVRCDTILMSWVITAVWLIKLWEVHKKTYYLLLGCAAIAFGMMTKGPIALMVPVFCFISDWALKRDWKKFLQPVYIPGIIVIAVLLLPMSIGLYQQFDLHPDKVVNGAKGLSGLRFFYWTQSFGRITGESPWQNGVDLSFLLSNMLWSFLPWIFLFLPAVVVNTLELVRQRFRLQPGQEWLSTGGFLLAYLSLGSSKYQLPHYIFVAFPLAAIVVAKLLRDFYTGKYRKLYNVMRPFMAVISSLLFVATLLVVTFVFPMGIWGIVLWTASLAAWLVIIFKKQDGRSFMIWASAIMIANVIMTHFFYYNLLQYQAGSQVGRYLRHNHITGGQVVYYKMHDPMNALPFYAQEVISKPDTIQNIHPQAYILTQEEGLQDLHTNHYTYDTVKQGTFFKVSELTPDFLNANTRYKALQNYYLVRVR